MSLKLVICKISYWCVNKDVSVEFAVLVVHATNNDYVHLIIANCISYGS